MVNCGFDTRLGPAAKLALEEMDCVYKELVIMCFKWNYLDMLGRVTNGIQYLFGIMWLCFPLKQEQPAPLWPENFLYLQIE